MPLLLSALRCFCNTLLYVAITSLRCALPLLNIALLRFSIAEQHDTRLYFSIAKQNLSSPCLYLTIIDCASPLQHVAIRCHHFTKPCWTLPLLFSTMPNQTMPIHNNTLQDRYHAELRLAFPALCHTSPLLNIALLHSSLAMQVNSLLFSTEQYHDITIPVSAMPLRHLTLQFPHKTEPNCSMPLPNYALLCHSDTTLSLCHSWRFRASTEHRSTLPLLCVTAPH